jgi:hypothetical protein
MIAALDARLPDKATGETDAEKATVSARRIGHCYTYGCSWTIVHTGPHIHRLEPERMA